MKLRPRPKTFSSVRFHSSSCFSCTEVVFYCMPGGSNQHLSGGTQQNEALNSPNEAGDESCYLGRMSQQSLGLRGKEGPRVGAGISHRAELSLSLCEALFSPAAMPASTTEAGYRLPTTALLADRGLQLLPSFG